MFSEIFKVLFGNFFKPVQQKTIIQIPIKSTYQHSSANLKAILSVLRWAEGTAQIPNSDGGYKAIVGGGTFESYADHPRKSVWIRRIGKFSDAAGAYQIMAKQWDAYKDRLGLVDFSPKYQDVWALNALREVNALDDVYSGRFEEAIKKCGNRWASLPGSKFGQSIRTIAELKDQYSSSGGQFAT